MKLPIPTLAALLLVLIACSSGDKSSDGNDAPETTSPSEAVARQTSGWLFTLSASAVEIDGSTWTFNDVDEVVISPIVLSAAYVRLAPNSLSLNGPCSGLRTCLQTRR